MRYRRDIPLALIDQRGVSITEPVVHHIVQHLLGATHPDDELTGEPDRLVTLYREDHPDNPDLISFIGEIDAEPNTPYLRPDFDPAADHPHIVFTPYEEPDIGHFADRDAYQRWSARREESE